MGCCSIKQSDLQSTTNKNQKKHIINNQTPNKNPSTAPPILQKSPKTSIQDKKLAHLNSLILQNQNLTLLLDSPIFSQFLNELNTKDMPSSSKNALITLLQNYIRYSIKVISFRCLKVQVPQYYHLGEFGDIVGRQIREIRDHLNTQNNHHVRTLRFFQEFKIFTFDIGQNNQKEIDCLEDRVKLLAQDDKFAVFYMVSYLKKACKKMKEQGMELEQINKKLKKAVDAINEKFGPNADYKEQLQQIYRVQKREVKRLTNEEHDYKQIQFELKQKDKKKELNQRIVEISDYAKNQEQIFHNLTYLSCIRNQGFGYCIGSKVRNIEDERAIKRVKQKLLKDQIQKHYKNKKYKSKNIKDLRKQEFKFKKNVMAEVYQSINHVKFDVTDLLRGRCFFSKLSKINDSAQEIIRKIKELKKTGQQVQLIQIDNRLEDITNDMVLKIQIKNIVTQFQLGLRFSENQSEIYHKMYEISRSEMLSPLVQLYQTERKLTNQYFHALDQAIKEINEPKQVKQSIKKKMEQLKKFIQFKQDHEDDQSQDQIGQSPYHPYEGLYKQQNIIPEKVEELKKQRQMRTGDFLSELGIYEWASKYYVKQMQQVHPSEKLIKQNAMNKIGNLQKLNKIKSSNSLEQICLNV